jgi:prepilin-type N-terminal cleavage/methylation domain-containing protein
MNKAFTLIELSIVLVIIGLIISGVLVGRDLIQAATIRRQLSQIEQLDTVVNTFRVKYGGTPGDLAASKAASLGFASRSGAQYHGDGNGTIDTCSSGTGSDSWIGCETSVFWRDLAEANLIAGSFINSGDLNLTNVTVANRDQYLPRAALGQNNYLTIFSNSFTLGRLCNGGFCYAIIGSPIVDGGGGLQFSFYITPMMVFAMDSKRDDGKPETGMVLGGPPSVIVGVPYGLSMYALHNTVPGAGYCKNFSTANTYNLDEAHAALAECVVNFISK